MQFIVKVLDIICVFSLVLVFAWEAGISFVHSNVKIHLNNATAIKKSSGYICCFVYVKRKESYIGEPFPISND